MVVVYFLAVAAYLPQELLHINGQLKLLLDNLYERVLADAALFVRLAAQADEAVQVLVGLVLLLGLQLEFLEVRQGGQQGLHVDAGRLPLVQECVYLLDARVGQVVTAGLQDLGQFESFDVALSGLVVESEVLFADISFEGAQFKLVCIHVSCHLGHLILVRCGFPRILVLSSVHFYFY